MTSTDEQDLSELLAAQRRLTEAMYRQAAAIEALVAATRALVTSIDGNADAQAHSAHEMSCLAKEVRRLGGAVTTQHRPARESG